MFHFVVARRTQSHKSKGGAGTQKRRKERINDADSDGNESMQSDMSAATTSKSAKDRSVDKAPASKTATGKTDKERKISTTSASAASDRNGVSSSNKSTAATTSSNTSGSSKATKTASPATGKAATADEGSNATGGGDAMPPKKRKTGTENVDSNGRNGGDLPSAAVVVAPQQEQPNGFDLGLQPVKILGASDASGELMFLMKWQGHDRAELVKAKVANVRCPMLVIAFYEQRLTWHTEADSVDSTDKASTDKAATKAK